MAFWGWGACKQETKNEWPPASKPPSFQSRPDHLFPSFHLKPYYKPIPHFHGRAGQDVKKEMSSLFTWYIDCSPEQASSWQAHPSNKSHIWSQMLIKLNCVVAALKDIRINWDDRLHRFEITGRAGGESHPVRFPNHHNPFQWGSPQNGIQGSKLGGWLPPTHALKSVGLHWSCLFKD